MKDPKHEEKKEDLDQVNNKDKKINSKEKGKKSQ